MHGTCEVPDGGVSEAPRHGSGEHTLVVGGTARAAKAHVAQGCVAIRGGHGAVGGGVSEVGRGALGAAWRALRQARGRRVELVGECV